MLEPYAKQIQTVTELTRSIRGLLETQFPFVTVTGEISNLRRPYSGHLYFTLKDKEAQIRAVLFKPQQRYLRTAPQDGRQVVCRGRISVYEQRGEYQLIVDTVDHYGTGILQADFERLKEKLAKEGLFDASHKQALPFLPERIGVISSPQGAAVFDFLKIAAGRFPSIPIEIFPVRVQGETAAGEIVEAIQAFNTRGSAQVLILCRGGGSIEDLWPFNEEKVARAIFASAIPVVSAVGHEIDFTIADFVADHRAPTPTAAAEIVMPDRQALHDRLSETSGRLGMAMARTIDAYRHGILSLKRLLGSPDALLTHFLLVLDHAQSRMLHTFSRRLIGERSRFDTLKNRLFKQNPEQRLRHDKFRAEELAEKLNLMIKLQLERKVGALQKKALLLDAVSPLAILGRGYAIARTLPGKTVIHSGDQVQEGETIEVVLHKGSIDCQVKTTHKGETTKKSVKPNCRGV